MVLSFLASFLFLVVKAALMDANIRLKIAVPNMAVPLMSDHDVIILRPSMTRCHCELRTVAKDTQLANLCSKAALKIVIVTIVLNEANR